jgi:hypothetical protein
LNLRIEKRDKILFDAKSAIANISEHELFLIGVVLYWAEGAKEKESRPGSAFEFSNMDPKMIQIFIVWLLRVCKIKRNMLIFNIFLHQTHKTRVEEVREYWSSITGFSVDSFTKVYFKRSKIKKTNRKNVGETYHGVLKIIVRKSSELVRKISSWSERIFEEVLKIKK